SSQFGLDVIRRLRGEDPSVRLVLMTSNPERGLNETAREAGAQGSLLKTGSAADVLSMLRAIAAGRRSFDPRHPPRKAGAGAPSYGWSRPARRIARSPPSSESARRR